MISADTSVLVAYLQGKNLPQTLLLENALLNDELIISKIVICELLSDPKLTKRQIEIINSLPTLEIFKDFYKNAGLNRAKLISKKLKARLADSLIAQNCIDNNIALITLDADFRHFEKYCSLKIVKIN
jgi:predicted nucleic acid-binding protein